VTILACQEQWRVTAAATFSGWWCLLGCPLVLLHDSSCLGLVIDFLDQVDAFFFAQTCRPMREAVRLHMDGRRVRVRAAGRVPAIYQVPADTRCLRTLIRVAWEEVRRPGAMDVVPARPGQCRAGKLLTARQPFP
jgi:hypothetical protein